MLRSLSRAAFGVLIGLFFISEAVRSEEKPALSPLPDKVVVLKSKHLLMLMKGDQRLQEYQIALGGDPVGPKVREGDHKTPEGIYLLDRRNPKSRFYKSIHISYPDAKDRAQAARLGVPPGGDIMIHGLPNGFGWLGRAHRARDWTDGCIAVTNQEMDQIWSSVADGTPLEIKP